MNTKMMLVSKLNLRTILLAAGVILILSALAGCGPSEKILEAADYAPLEIDGDLPVSTPEEQDLDPLLVAELYHNASKLETVYSVLVVKNGYLIAEDYFNEAAVDTQYNLQSATKSYVSALVGLAFDQGCLTSLDQPFLEFFPEYADQIEDPTKETITVRHLLQMRSGYPWEESHPDLWAGLLTGDWLAMMVEYPLVTDPGTKFHYSNASSDWLAAIVARACEVDLWEFTEEHLFAPMGAELGEWWYTEENPDYPMGACCIHVTARDAAKFGLLYLNDGEFDGQQIISADWVAESLQAYSMGEELQYVPPTGPNFERIGYGYQWWRLQSGEHEYATALGHGGQMIALLDELDMVIVVTGDPFWLESSGQQWRNEKRLKNLVANFIAALSSE